jgi:glycerol-3-phosphate acyltransferase PlsX
MLKVGLFKGSLKGALKSTDYQEYGGVPLLGIKGISIIGHGSSGPKAIKNMVLRAKEMYDHRIVEKTRIAIQEFGTEKDSQ